MKENDNYYNLLIACLIILGCFYILFIDNVRIHNEIDFNYELMLDYYKTINDNMEYRDSLILDLIKSIHE